MLSNNTLTDFENVESQLSQLSKQEIESLLLEIISSNEKSNINN